MSSIADVWVTVKADTTGLAGEIEQGAAKPIEKAGRESAGRFGRAFSGNKTVLNALGAAAGQVIGTAVGRGAGSILNGSAADNLGRFSTNIGSLGGGLTALGVGAGALGTVAAAADGLSGASDLLASSTGALSAAKGFFITTTNAETGAVTASGIARAKDTVITLAHTAAEKGAAAASKVFAAGQWLVNAALTANPIGLVIVGVAALVAGFVLAYKKSETFRSVVHKLWAILQKFIGFTPLGAILTHFDAIKDRISWILEKIGDLGHKLTHIPGVSVLGKIPGFARGGRLKPGLNVVGERGPELLMSARGGQRVLNAVKTRKIVSGYPEERMSPYAAQLLATWDKLDRLDRGPRTSAGFRFNPKMRLDTSQVADWRRAPDWAKKARPVQKRQAGVVIHGGITVVAHKVEDAGDAVARKLRGVAHGLGF